MALQEERSWVKPVLFVAVMILVASWGTWKYKQANKVTSNVIHIQTTNADPRAGKGFLPEQRRKFALEFVVKLSGTDSKVTVTTKDAHHTTMFVNSDAVNGQLANEFANNNGILRALRGMGFKHLVMSNGNTAWDIDLKN